MFEALQHLAAYMRAIKQMFDGLVVPPSNLVLAPQTVPEPKNRLKTSKSARLVVILQFWASNKSGIRWQHPKA